MVGYVGAINILLWLLEVQLIEFNDEAVARIGLDGWRIFVDLDYISDNEKTQGMLYVDPTTTLP